MTDRLVDQAVRAAAGIDLDRVPPNVVTHLGHVIADTVAVSRAGADSEQMTRLIREYIADGLVHLPDAGEPAAGPSTSSTVLSPQLPRSGAQLAAFLNATAGAFLELDEGMRPTGHPGMHVVPAALAVAERRHVPGRDLMRAVLAGYEVTSRLFGAFRLRYPVHPHGHFGGVGGAVAVALIEGVDPVLAARAAGTAVLLPIWDACYEGATVRNTWIGLAAQNAVRATALVRAGFEGSPSAVEAGYGTIAGDLVDAGVMTAPLDYDHLGITRNYFKLHSACALTHAAIDAVEQMKLPGSEEVLSVRVETVENNMKLDRQPRANDLSGRFSLPYAVATVIALGRSDPDAFHFRPEVAALAQLVTVSVADDLQARWPEASPARVTVRTKAGTVTKTVDNPRGHHTQPIDAGRLQEKFLQLVGAEDGPRWWQRLTSLETVADVAGLFARSR